MGKKLKRNKKGKNGTVVIIVIATVVLTLIATLLIYVASKNDNLGSSGTISSPNQTKVVTLKLYVDANEGEPHYEAAKMFAEEVEEKTKGDVKVAVQSTNQFTTAMAMIYSMARDEGIVDIVIAPVADFTDIEESMDISTLPFMFDGLDSAWAFMDGDIQGQIEDSLRKKNVNVIAHYSGVMSGMVTTNAEINRFEDLKNLTMIIRKGEQIGKDLSLVGVQTVGLSADEIADTLQSKMYDGFIGDISYIYEKELYMGQKYVSMTYQSYEGYAFAISNSTWEELEEYQDIIERAAEKSANYDRETIREKENQLLKKMEESGVTIVYPNASNFAEETEAILRQYSSKYGDLLDNYLLRK